MNKLLEGVFQKIRRRKYSDNEAILRAFINAVENGYTPNKMMLEFMADGAREFLRGGKPWQRGKGGRPGLPFGEYEIKQWMLSEIGGLKPFEIAVIFDLIDEKGADVSRTIKRNIDRGSVASFNATLSDPALLERLVMDLLALELTDLTDEKRRKCRQELKNYQTRLVDRRTT